MTDRLDENLNSPAAALGAYWDAVGAGAVYAPVELSAEQLRCCARLSTLERVTLRVEVPATPRSPTHFGLLIEAQVRLGVLALRGALDRMSGQEIAAHLQMVLFQGVGRPSLRANRGFQVLAELDARDMIRADVSTAMSSDARDGYRTLRLSERVREISQH